MASVRGKQNPDEVCCILEPSNQISNEFTDTKNDEDQRTAIGNKVFRYIETEKLAEFKDYEV